MQVTTLDLLPITIVLFQADFRKTLSFLNFERKNCRDDVHEYLLQLERASPNQPKVSSPE